jgi:hypothetical protein
MLFTSCATFWARARAFSGIKRIHWATLTLSFETSASREVPVVPSIDGKPAPGFLVGGVPWALWFMATGLGVPALIIDTGRSPWTAMFRGMRLVMRSHLRPGGIRLLAYLPWFAIRLLVVLIGAFTGPPVWLDYTIWILINTAAYASIASVDATAHLEARIRREGLDIALGRAVRRGMPGESVLAAPR